MKFQDYYITLGVDRKADDKTIKQAYRRLARKYHPDVSKESDAEEKFKQLQEAYEVLKDEKKRQAYDNYGEQWKAAVEQGVGSGGAHAYSGTTHKGDDVNDLFGDIFSDFARGGRNKASWRGRDEYADINISLKEAYHGTTRKLSLQSWEINEQGQPSPITRSLNVRIPAGVTDGQRIRLKGQGQKGSGDASSGDLYLSVSINTHTGYRLNKKDLYFDLPVTPWEAALGSQVVAPTIAGKLKLTIPRGSQAGNELRLRGKGLPGFPPGDLFAVIKVILPTPQSETEEECYRMMEKTMSFDAREKMEVWK
ncbi:MAG: curved DNA-binding protein [Planctomycetota bacterium]|jgi:curved DNA-binding protein